MILSIPRVVFWLGLAWVYSGVPFLLGALALLAAGWPEGAIACGVHVAASLVIGVGLCATERWAWAPAVSLSILYVVAGVSAIYAGGWAVVVPGPRALSWQPVLFGLTVRQCTSLGIWGLLLAGVGATYAVCLWRTQEHFDVPYRRPFSLLVRYGILPTLAIVAADVYLVHSCWLRLTGR